MLVTFEEPPYAIKVTPAHPPSSPASFRPVRPPPASPRLPAVRGSAAHSGSGGGGADINMADAFPLCGVCEQQ